MLEIEAHTPHAELKVDLQSEALKHYAKLMGEWARSRGEEKETDSPMLRDFKRFSLEFTDDAGHNVALISVNEFARAQTKIQAGEATDESLEPFLDTAITAHNRVMYPTQQVNRSTYQQEGWNREQLIHDTLFYAALPVFVHRRTQQETH